MKKQIFYLSKEDQQLFRSMFTGILSGLIVASSGIFASCYILQSCTSHNLFIQVGFTFGFSIAIFFLFFILAIILSKRKG